MTKAEMVEYLKEHLSDFPEYSESEIIYVVAKWNKKADAEIVEETLCHIWTGFYDAEPVKEVFAEQVCKHCYAMKRNRKIADNRKHYARICAKKGVM